MIKPLTQNNDVSASAQPGPTDLLQAVRFAPEHLRAARGLLNWSRKDLKTASGVSMETIKNIESCVWRPNEVSHQKLVDTFAKHGVEFIWLRGMSHYGLKVGGVMHIAKEEPKSSPPESAT